MGVVLNVLDAKGHNVLTVTPDTSVHDALDKMEAISAGTAVVTKMGKVLGIFSERDVIRKVVLEKKSTEGVRVEEIMSHQLVTVEPSDTLGHCMDLITSNRIRHLPVMEHNGELCGIVSIGDVVKYLVRERDSKIKNLESYISGVM